jgi:hypothetical protein
MCDAHDCRHTTDLTRRGLVGMALAGAASLALPGGARAADIQLDALCLMCIDYRLVTSGVNNFNTPGAGRPGPGQSKYDLVTLAGASLAATSETNFSLTMAGFWQQFGAAWALHKIQKLVVLDHMGCGAYDVQFNGGNRLPPDREFELHKQQMRRLRDILPEHARAVGAPATMPVEFWIFMDPANPSMAPTRIVNP